MYLVTYIKDCKRYMRDYPLTKDGNKRIYYRNVLYINSQPRYLFGRLIDKIIRLYDSIYHSIKEAFYGFQNE